MWTFQAARYSVDTFDTSSPAAALTAAASVKAALPGRLVYALNCNWTAAELLEWLEDQWRSDYPDISGLPAAPTGEAITVLFGGEWITGHFEISPPNPQASVSGHLYRTQQHLCLCCLSFIIYHLPACVFSYYIGLWKKELFSNKAK